MLKLMFVQGDSPEEVNAIIDQFFGLPAVREAAARANGHRVTTHVLTTTATPEAEAALIEAPAEVIQIRKKQPPNPEDDPIVQVWLADLRAAWTEDVLEQALDGINEGSYDLLVRLAERSPAPYSYEEIKRVLGINGHALGSRVASYGHWRGKRKLPDFLFRNTTQFYYWMPPFVADWVLEYHTGVGAPTRLRVKEEEARGSGV